MNTPDDLFGQPLQPDPAIALTPVTVDPKLLMPGPLHKLHFAVEIVGQRTMPAPQAKALLDPKWQAALGQPSVYVMAPADRAWRPLSPADTSGAYDSVAIAWPYLSARGSLSHPAAQQLLRTAEQFAQQVQRRAMPVPDPADVPKMVQQITKARDNLDVGFSLTAEARMGISERSIWIACAHLGLELSGDGFFQYRAKNWEEPIVEVYPLSGGSFSLGAVQRGDAHEGVGIGYSIPRSPDPMLALEAALKIAEHFERSFGCVIYDESENPLGQSQKQGLRENVAQAIWALGQFGLTPGSVEARQLFMP